MRDSKRYRLLRFIVAGGVNTLFGFALYTAAVLAGAPVWLALMIGLVVGTAFNFVSTGGYAFRDMALARFPRFVLCYLLSYCINLQLIVWLSSWVGGTISAQAILVLPMAVFSYLLLTRFVFRAGPV